MSAPTQPAANTGIHDLATRIYVELIGRSYLRVENAATFKPDAAELAKLSIRLAATFRKEEIAAEAALLPQNVGYEVDLGDMAKWDK